MFQKTNVIFPPLPSGGGGGVTVDDEGKVVELVDGVPTLVTQTALTVTDNGVYDTTANDEVTVNVPSAQGVSF